MTEIIIPLVAASPTFLAMLFYFYLAMKLTNDHYLIIALLLGIFSLLAFGFTGLIETQQCQEALIEKGT